MHLDKKEEGIEHLKVCWFENEGAHRGSKVCAMLNFL